LDEFSLSFAQCALLLNSTKKYIYALDAVSNRISQNRMIAKGYGERKLTNNCADGINCNEEEHQKNRRTEVRILRFDEEGVEIKKE
jgi:hypothetical protein